MLSAPRKPKQTPLIEYAGKIIYTIHIQLGKNTRLYCSFLVITNLTHFFMYLFISCLYMFRASQRSSSGDRIVLIHHLVWLVSVSDCFVCRSGLEINKYMKKCVKLVIT